MAVKITSRIYQDNFKPNENTDWLLGNVGDIQKLTLQCETAVEYVVPFGETISVSVINKSLTLNNGKSWRDYGFNVGVLVSTNGEIVDTDNSTTPPTVTTGSLNLSFTPTLIYGSVMEVDVLPGSFSDFSLIPGNQTDGTQSKKISGLIFFQDVMPEGARITYSHIENSQAASGNLNNALDGSLAVWENKTITEASFGVPLPCFPIGQQSGMGIFRTRIKYTGKVNATHRRTFEIEIYFVIPSFLNDITNFETPLNMPDYLEGIGSLTDNFLISFLPVWNNPNVKIENDPKQTALLGNTGWFNENYNQIQNFFTVDSVNYYDAANGILEALDFRESTKVVVTVSGVANLNTNTKCLLGLAYVPLSEDDYKNNDYGIQQNLYLDLGDRENPITVGTPSAQSYLGFEKQGGYFVRNSQRAEIVNGKLVITAEINPNNVLGDLLETRPGDRNYIIYVSVANQVLGRKFSDRVSLLADVNEFKKSVPKVGPFENIQAKFIEHPNDENHPGTSIYNGFVQDGFLSRFNMVLKPSKDVITNVIFGVEAYNLNTGKSYELEQIPVNLSNQITDLNNIQQIQFEQSRGFRLNDGNKNNLVKIVRDPGNDNPANANGAEYAYLLFFATKIRWEDWLLRVGVPIEFFDSNQLRNGFNNDWVNYASALGYELRVFTKIESNRADGLVEYKNAWQLAFNDYDLNQEIITEHKYFRTSNNALLNTGIIDTITGATVGAILKDEQTTIEISYRLQNGQNWENNKAYAIITIEVDNGGGQFTQWQLSNIYPREGNNPLKGPAGFTKLKMEYLGDTLKTSCVVDPGLLEPGQRYRVTGRVGCYDGKTILIPGIYSAKYSSKYE